MHAEKGQILELILEDGHPYVHVACSTSLVPAPGQYLLASDSSQASLPLPLYYTESTNQGFIAAGTPTTVWSPGLELYLRGPLGRGFSLPLSSRKVGLVAFDDSPAHLRGLIRPALKQDAAVVFVGHSTSDNLPDDVEVQPLSALLEILEWADYVAFDVKRENLNALRERLAKWNPLAAGKRAQFLIRTPVPCGGIAECGVCAVTLRSEWKLACKDGPVFDWEDL